MTPLEQRVFWRHETSVGLLLLGILAGVAVSAPRPVAFLHWAFLLGALYSLASAWFAVWRARRMLRGAGEPDKAGFLTSHKTEVVLPLPLAETLRLAEAAVRALEPHLEVAVSPDRRIVSALQVAPNGLAPGSLVRVTCAESEGRVQATRASIVTAPVGKLTWNDHGQSGRNAEAVARALNRAVAQMQEEQRESAARATLSAQLDKARLGLLQAQVEPHFLYNTLANVQLLIRSDPEAADRMTASLIAYLRSSLPDFRGSETTVAREMALVEAYLGIMQIRMGPRLRMAIHVAPEVAHSPVAPLLIHTLAENAIKHGIEPQPGGGRIEIRAERTSAGRLRITVEDDGMGLRPEQRGDGVGLANLCERLAILHGDAATFAIEAREPRGVLCTVEMPLKEAARHAG
jgi:signal transduction histidine kinase